MKLAEKISIELCETIQNPKVLVLKAFEEGLKRASNRIIQYSIELEGNGLVLGPEFLEKLAKEIRNIGEEEVER